MIYQPAYHWSATLTATYALENFRGIFNVFSQRKERIQTNQTKYLCNKTISKVRKNPYNQDYKFLPIFLLI